MKVFFTAFTILVLAIQTFAQYDYLNIPIQKNAKSSTVAWAGGLNAPQFSTVDLNNDGIEDLLVYDRSGQIALPFLNSGTSNQVAYSYAPEYRNRFPQNTENYMLLRDYNQDGIEDLFYFARTTTHPTGGMALLQGSYDVNNKIKFTAIDSTIHYTDAFSNFYPIFIYNPDIPAITDIDNDGDMDILAFSANFVFSTNISWYKNMSVENGNGLGTPEYILEHECWGMVTETNNNNTVFLSPNTDTCFGNPFWQKSPRHAGSTLAAIDYNGDGIKDIVMGDVTISTLNLLTNSLANDTFLVVSQDSTYPSYDIPVDIFDFPAAFFLDVNNDGKTDMIAAPNEMQSGNAITDSVAWYYQNTQSNSNIQLDFQQKDFLVGDMVDLGQDASPVFFDYNGDGLLDILIGHMGYCQNNSSYKTGLTLLENTGTTTAPSFLWVTNNYANLDTLQLTGMHPTVGDLNGDGDQDLILGVFNGTLVFVENTAGAGNTATWANPVLHYKSIDIGTNSTPQLKDLDRDGDLDLAIGEYNGNINYFENTGNATNATFSNTPTTIGLSGMDINLLNPSSQRSAPCFIDIAGKYELFIGHQNGFPIHLKNIDGNLLSNYDTVSLGINTLWTGRYTDLDAADINNDGRLDLVIGNSRGGISFFAVDTFTVAVDLIANTAQNYIQNIYPNPTQDYLNIELKEANTTAISFVIFNTLGQIIFQQNSKDYNDLHRLDIRHLNTGVYWLETNYNGKRQTNIFVME